MWASQMMNMEDKYYVYMVMTKKCNLYTGISTDPVRRCKEHNETKRVAKCLRGQLPVVLVWTMDIPLEKSVALRFEAKIKKFTQKQKFDFLKGNIPVEIDQPKYLSMRYQEGEGLHKNRGGK